MGVLLSAGLYVVVRLGALPGQIAKRREHPQADAIQVAGWLGILTMGLLWPLALIWAFGHPPSRIPADSGLREEIAQLTERVRTLEARRGGGAEGSGR